MASNLLVSLALARRVAGALVRDDYFPAVPQESASLAWRSGHRGGDLAQADVAFLFLGETLLMPHLFPAVEALSRLRPDLRILLWVSTSLHERMLRQWLGRAPHIQIARAPGFRRVDGGHNPVLPNKLLMLARLAPALARTPVVVCAEQTSLWLPTLLPLETRFVKTSHGAGSMSARDDRRRRAAWKMLVPSEMERRTYLDRGYPPERIAVTGYVKAAFDRRSRTDLRFDRKRPVILYAPHWQKHRSSWWSWGREIVDRLARQDRYNVIFAPHQRLIEGEPEIAAIVARLNRLDHVHADCDSFAMVDGSYTHAADLYLGDTSGMAVEFMARPRPCVFLNDQALDWQATDDHGFWQCGEVVDDLSRLGAAIDAAPARHAEFRRVQETFATAALGDLGGNAPVRLAEEIVGALDAI